MLVNETDKLKRSIKRLEGSIAAHDFKVFSFEVSSELITAFRHKLEVVAIRAHRSVGMLVYKVTFESLLLSETGITDVARME